MLVSFYSLEHVRWQGVIPNKAQALTAQPQRTPAASILTLAACRVLAPQRFGGFVNTEVLF